MKNQFMSQYLTKIKKIKTLVDNISLAGVKLDVEDIILYTLNELPPQYQLFKAVIYTKLTPMSLEDMC